MIVGTEEYEFTSTDMFAKDGIRLTCVKAEMWDAMLMSLLSLHGRPKISIPMGTPISASSVGGEKPAGGGAGGPRRAFGDLWARGRSAGAWAALLAASVIAGLVVLWVIGHLGSVRGGR